MKIFIDKHGGLHYHKESCDLIQRKTPPIFPYEPIIHRVRKYGLLKEYGNIVVDGRYYSPCPYCFGHGGER